MKFKKHLFVCTNQREDGKKSCGAHTGMQLVNALKAKINSGKLHLDVRAQKAGCLDICEFGPAMVVYPEGVAYGNVQESDIEEIYQSHIVNNQPVERLRLRFDKS